MRLGRHFPTWQLAVAAAAFLVIGTLQVLGSENSGWVRASGVLILGVGVFYLVLLIARLLGRGEPPVDGP